MLYQIPGLIFEPIDSVECRHSSDSRTTKLIIGIEEVTERGPPTCGILMNGRSTGEEVKDYFAKKEGTYIGQHCTPHRKINFL